MFYCHCCCHAEEERATATAKTTSTAAVAATSIFAEASSSANDSDCWLNLPEKPVEMSKSTEQQLKYSDDQLNELSKIGKWLKRKGKSIYTYLHENAHFAVCIQISALDNK